MTQSTDNQDRSFPYVLVCSTLATVVSLASVWLATAISYAPGWSPRKRAPVSMEDLSMTRHSNHRPFAFVSSTLGVTLISVVAAWTVSSAILDPVAPNSPSVVRLKPDQPTSRHLFRISPIPPGADWTA